MESDSAAPWVDACTLPTVERPLRVAEFDTLFASVRAVEPVGNTLRLTFDGTMESAVRELTARESECCSFFEWAFTKDSGTLTVEVSVPPGYVDVLAALAERARAGRSG